MKIKTNASAADTLIVMPETEGRTLCIEARGYVTLNDHQDKVKKGLERILKEYDTYNLLVCYAPEYRGWEADAADSSMQSIIDYGRKARKLAYVNPPEKKIVQMKITKELFSGETRFFAAEELQQAIEWVKN